ncbi:hypothetical protein [uncultured Psychroserpens sp.]|uniref:hypothetical protein n=1 Tax=uncultured Psychroserpens sp. TaxID=255436 RepID=UPI00262DDA17|nr:hypothetical protein [uncultured Psychroserpens sp.]
MKLLKYIKLVIVIFTLFSCSSGDDNNPNENIAGRISSCDNAIGYTGLYWDFANAKPTGLTQVPLIQNPGQQFVHSQIPLLGFTIPQGFTAFEVTDPQTQTLGVNVFRDDNAVLFRWVPTSTIFNQAVPSQSVIANEINTMFNFYGFNGTPDVLCSEFKQQVISTIPMEFNARLLRFNGRIAQVWVITTYAAGNTYVTISVTTAPETEYDTQVANTFLPINFQLYVNESGGIVDNDMDGFDILRDPDDNDPTVPGNN